MSADPDSLVLRDRARALARVAESTAPDEESLELLEFRLADERYAVETRHVVEVHPFRDLTPLPGTPAFVRGIVNLRGRIIAVFDLKKFFDLPERGITDLHRIVVVRGHGLELGLLADTVTSVRRLSRASLAPSLPTLTDIGAEYLLGVNEERLVVLDLDRVFEDPRIVLDEDVSE
jgi:purine-binding chemotaxis protein CheW